MASNIDSTLDSTLTTNASVSKTQMKTALAAAASEIGTLQDGGFSDVSGTGVLCVNSANTSSVVREITGTSAEITVTNGTGVSGAPTLSLPDALTFTGKTITGGTYASATISGGLDLNGLELTLDADADTSITADSDDVIDIEIAGTDSMWIGHGTGNTGAFVHLDPVAHTNTTTVNYGILRVGNSNAITVPSGTTAIVAGAYFETPNWTATGTITKSSTVYVEGAASEGGTDYALWVDDGAVQLDSTLTVGSTITGPSGTWDSGGMDIAASDTYAINGTNVLGSTTLGTGVVTSSLTTVGVLASGSIASGFGTISTGNTITTTALITGSDLTLTATDPDIIGGDTDGVLSITGDTSTSEGGVIKLYGNQHGSKAQDIEFLADTTLVGNWDESAGTWDFNNIDGTVLGATTAAAGAFTTITGSTSLALATGSTVTGIADQDNMSSDSAALLATQQSIKAYVDDTTASLGTATALAIALG